MPTLERNLTAYLIGPEPRALAMALRYEQEDPYALTVSFPGEAAEDPAHEGDAPEWTAARELFTCGLYQPAGDGDLRVAPVDTDLTAIELHGPGGCALVVTPSAPLGDYLARTFTLVPPGHESCHVSWPDTVEGLIGHFH